MHTVPNPTRAAARLTGILMLGVFAAYGAGSSLATTLAAGPDSPATIPGDPVFPIAGILMLANSAMVIAIGVLLYPVLERHNPRIALGYLATRLAEGIIMAVGVVSLMSLTLIGRASGSVDPATVGMLADLAVAGNQLAYNVAMAGLAFGSLFFCYLLGASGLVPRVIAVWGFVGYAALAIGCLLELAGVAGAGMIATLPGGLFEVFLAIWLIVKGFNPAVVRAVATDRLVAA